MADRSACERLAANCLHAFDDEDDLLLTPLGFEEPGVDRCPALGADARCTIHGRDKPSMCKAIPWDPLVPDRLQYLVLAERWVDSDDLGARCIARSSDPTRISVQGTRVLDLDARRSLATARRGLAADKRFWGAALHAQMVAHLLGEPGGKDRVPAKDFLVLPLTPVLQWLAQVSQRCHERCFEYLDAQIVLCETSAQERAARKLSSLEPSLARLRGFARANHVLRNVLQSSRPDPGASARAREIEDWIEGARPEVSVLLGGDRMA